MGRTRSMDVASKEPCDDTGVRVSEVSSTDREKGWDKSANLFTRLVRAQADAKRLEKTAKGNGFQYDYVTHDDIASEAKRILATHGVLFFPSIENVERDGNRSTVTVKALFINVDNSEERLETVGYGDGVDNQDKGLGKAYSYACKYILAKTLLLNTSDDVEAHNINHNPASSPEHVSETRESAEKQVKDWAKGLKALMSKTASYEELRKIKTDNQEMFKSSMVPEKTKEHLNKELDEKIELAKEALLTEVSADAS